ncbi:putative ankyrin repeat protein RF_0381 [Phymastichus coffea]|uniref:putative ankyrin repeat protein RF_0381 n=1 Tax=Phymastichus coffea TaxID=108790 RepID=UPI00273AE94D|nr:putative ankyrin repeat protein RF_0381 [Phymastichus coffea]
MFRIGINSKCPKNSYGDNEVHSAVRIGDVQLAYDMVRRGYPVNERNDEDRTPLNMAVLNGQHDMAKMLLYVGANPNDEIIDEDSLLHYATRKGDVAMMELLLNGGAYVDAKGISGKTPLFKTVEKSPCDAEWLLEPEHGTQCLLTAIECRRLEICQVLIRHEANVNAKDRHQRTLLYVAVKRNSHELVELLLEHGADINARDESRETVLHLAVRFGYVRLLDLLLQYGVDIDALNLNKQSALHLAVAHEPAKIGYYGFPHTFFARLLMVGARIHTRAANTDETLLHTAVRVKCLIFVKYLLTCGADVNATERFGRKTPLQFAVEAENADCVYYLLVYGANLSVVDLTQDINKEVKRAISRYFTRRVAANMYVEKKYLGLVNVEDEFFKECVEEVERMMTTELCDEQTYYEFLHEYRRRLANAVGNADLAKIFLHHAHVVNPTEKSLLQRIFPLYVDMLFQNYCVGIRHAPVLAAFDGLTYLLQFPAVVVDMIIKMLSRYDVKSLIYALTKSLDSNICNVIKSESEFHLN